jgi:transcription antitermination factor NusG
LSPRQEIKIRDEARKAGFDAFVPLCYEVKTIRGQKQRKLIPALSGLIFVKGELEALKAYTRESAYPVFIRKSTFSNHENYLVIPTKAMEDFIAVTQHREEHVSYFRPEEIRLQEGDRIRIKGGFFDGREGIIMRIKGKRNRHLVVQIPGFLVAAVELSPQMIELKETPLREKPSKNVDADKKCLLQLSRRLLFEIADKHKHEEEYYLLFSEMRRIRERLKPIKAFTPATEAELALSMYLSAILLNEDVDPSKEKLLTAVAKLKDTSKLKASCIEYLDKVNKLSF